MKKNNTDEKYFLGQQEGIRQVQSVLQGETKGTDKLTIQSIGRPGGIGKTSLQRHLILPDR